MVDFQNFQSYQRLPLYGFSTLCNKVCELRSYVYYGVFNVMYISYVVMGRGSIVLCIFRMARP